MNKMMLAATLVLSATVAVFADCGIPTTNAVPDAAYVYDFKASLKTVDAKSKSTKDPCDKTVIIDNCYRVKSSRKLQGLWIACDCGSIAAPVTYITSNASKNKLGTIGDATFAVLNFFGKTASSATIAQGLVDFDYTDRIAYFDADGFEQEEERNFSLRAAGFGKAKGGILQSLSGQIVGQADPAMCVSKCAIPVEAIAYNPCDLTDDDSLPDIATGSWSLKYNSKLSSIAQSSGEDAAAIKKFPKVDWQ